MDLSGSFSHLPPFLWVALKGRSGAATARQFPGHGGREGTPQAPDGRSARLYPLPVWEAIEARLATLPSTNPAKRKFLEVTAYYGSVVEPDAQGRFVIPPTLREAAQLVGEVAVLGQMDHIALWNKASFERRLAAEPLSQDDLSQLADLGI